MHRWASYPNDAWQIVRFDDLGAIEVIDTGDGTPYSDVFIILPSALYPGPPPKAFLQALCDSSVRAICIRRRGFGLTTSGASPEHEITLINRLVETLGNPDVHLLALGSAAPLALKLYSQSERVRSVDFVNLPSESAPEGTVRNVFWKKMIAQSFLGVAGTQLVLNGIKRTIRREGPNAFVDMFFSSSESDIAFLNANEALVLDAASASMSYSARCLHDEIVSAFFRSHEPIIMPGKAGFRLFSGRDAPPAFKHNENEFASKCGAEVSQLSQGYILSVYMCADEYISSLKSRKQ